MRAVNQDDEEDIDVNGILIDWDLCKAEEDLSKGPAQPVSLLNVIIVVYGPMGIE